jgi:hypothetical protein
VSETVVVNASPLIALNAVGGGVKGRKPPDNLPGTPQRIAWDKGNVRNPQTGEDISPFVRCFLLDFARRFCSNGLGCAPVVSPGIIALPSLSL